MSNSWESLKEKGNEFFKEKKYEKAIEYYNKAIAVSQKQEVLYSNKGTCEKCLCLYKLALKDYQKALEINPKNAKNLNRIASVYLILGDFGEASMKQEKAVNLEPGNSAFKEQLSTIKSQIENWEKVSEKKKEKKYDDLENICKKMLIHSPEYIDLKLEYIEVLLENVKIGEAITFINSKVSKEDKQQNPLFEYLLSLSLYYDGSYDKAKKQAKIAKAAFEEYYKAGNTDDKEIDKKLIDLNEKLDKIEKAKNEANEIFKKGEYDEAIKAYTNLLEFDKNNKKFNSLIYANRALCYQKKKMNTEALKDSNMSVKLNPYYARGYLKRGNVYMLLEMYDDAKADFQHAKELDPNLKDVQGFLNDANREQKKAKNRDYYAILGVSKDADEREIKKAYKRMALKYHPDRNGESEETKKMAEKKFIDINDAYTVLSDPKKKRMYDQGIDPLNPETGSSDGGMHFSGGDMGDILNMFFSGAGGGRSGFTFSFGGPGSARGGRQRPGDPFSMFFG